MALDLFVETLELLADFERNRLDYAVAGAVALAIHGVPRATADLDLLVPAEQVDRALRVARGHGFIAEALPMRFADGTVMRRVSKLAGEEALTLDLLLVNDALRPAWESRLRVATERAELWVVSRDGLLRMKALAGRPQDLADIARLRENDR